MLEVGQSSVLLAAVELGSYHIVASLLQAGAELMQRLDEAMRKEDFYMRALSPPNRSHLLRVVNLLLEHGADPRSPTSDGRQAIALATELGASEIAEWLSRMSE